MIHAAAEARERCFNHTHRRATRKCFRCLRGMCDECVREWTGQPVCDPCILELEELERITHIPPRERVRRFGLSLRNFVIGMAILAILAVPASFVVRRLMSTPITPEEFARFRYAASGTFETEDGTNVLSTVLGARVVVASSDLPEYPARRLIDEFVGTAYTGWRTEDASFPHVIVVDVGQLTRPEKVNVQQQPDEPPETHVKDFEVEGSTESPEGPWESMGRFTAQPIPEVQRFMLERPLPARWIRLKVLSNYGGPYASLGEFDAFILPRSPFAQPSPTR
jgi:hypothetical protein